MSQTERPSSAALRSPYRELGPPRPGARSRAERRAPSPLQAAATASRSARDQAAIDLILEGEYIQANDRSFRAFLFDLITQTPGSAIHLDMSEVTVIDSATLGTLIAALKGAHANGGDVCITAASRQVHSVLDITGTAAILLADGQAEGSAGSC